MNLIKNQCFIFFMGGQKEGPKGDQKRGPPFAYTKVCNKNRVKQIHTFTLGLYQNSRESIFWIKHTTFPQKMSPFIKLWIHKDELNISCSNNKIQHYIYWESSEYDCMGTILRSLEQDRFLKFSLQDQPFFVK